MFMFCPSIELENQMCCKIRVSSKSQQYLILLEACTQNNLEKYYFSQKIIIRYVDFLYAHLGAKKNSMNKLVKFCKYFIYNTAIP